MPPEVTTEEWTNMAQAAAQPGLHHRPQGFRERLGFIAETLRERKILGRPAYEIIADFGAGFAVKTAVRSGVMLAGASTLGAIGAAVLAGAASGAVFAGGKEWLKQARENWREPLPPEAVTTKQQILERLNDLTPNDWKRLGSVTLRGAVVGAAFGLAGALVSDILHAASSAPAGDNFVSTPTPESVHAPAIPTETAVPDHIGVPTPDAHVPVTPLTDTQMPTPDTAPAPSGDIPSPAPSTDLPSTSPEATAIPTPLADSSPAPLPTETATSSPAGVPLTPEEPSVSPTPTIPSAPDTLPSVPPDTIPTHPGDIPLTPSPEVPSTPTEPGITPPSVEQLPVLPVDTITESVNNLKDMPLAAGSNPWQVATEILKQVDPGHVPSNAEIMEVTRAICEQNDISVPEWGISGSIDEHQIPIGYLLKIDPEVKSVITDIIKGGK